MEDHGKPQTISKEVIDAMIVDSNYDGPHLNNGKVDEQFVTEMIKRFKVQKKIHKKYAFQVILAIDKL